MNGTWNDVFPGISCSSKAAARVFTLGANATRWRNNVADAIFVVVIMAMASSLPIVRFTET
jgi:hypothetical protein